MFLWRDSLAGKIPGLISWREKSLISKSRHRKFSLLIFPDLHISALPCLSGVLQWVKCPFWCWGCFIGAGSIVHPSNSHLRHPQYPGCFFHVLNKAQGLNSRWSVLIHPQCVKPAWANMVTSAKETKSSRALLGELRHWGNGSTWGLSPCCSKWGLTPEHSYMWNRGAAASCSKGKTCLLSNSRTSEVFEIQIRS